MPLPGPIAFHLDQLEADIRRAGQTRTAFSRLHADSHVINALSFVVVTQTIESRATGARRAAHRVVDVAEAGLSGRALEDARDAALMALDRLRIALEGCRPSKRALDLKLDWIWPKT